MKRFTYGAVLSLLLAGAVVAAPPVITGPDSLYGEVGSWVEVPIKTEGKAVRVVPLTPGLKFFDQAKLADPKVPYVSTAKAGQYKILVYTGNEDGPSEPFIVTILFAPLSPDPTTPPVTPPVNPPAPVDPFTAAVQLAYSKDATPNKSERVKQLAASMRSAATLAFEATIPTNAALAARVSKDTDANVGAGQMAAVRQEIGKYLQTQFPAAVVPLTPELRAKFKDAYLKCAAALETIP